ncbi:MAG: DUF6364 family protein [bacterium]
MTNLTLAIDETVLRKARKAAIDRDTTVTALVRDFLGQISASQEQAADTHAEELARAFARNTVKLGRRTWTREDLHERR